MSGSAVQSNRWKLPLAIALLILSAAIFTMTRGSSPPTSTGGGQWMVNLATGERFLAPAGEIPPIPAPSGGGEAVLAHVFSCTGCADASSQFVGYLERYTPDVRQRIVDLNNKVAAATGDDAVLQREQLDTLKRVSAQVRSSEGGEWMASQDPRANAIYTAAEKKCTPDQNLQRCIP